MKAMRWWAATALLAALVPMPAAGGNRELIEKRVRELHAINRQVVEQVPDADREDGVLRVRATVLPHEGGVRIEEIAARGDRAVTDAGSAAAPQAPVTFRDAIARYVRQPVEIVALAPAADRGEYAPFYLGIRGLARGSRSARTP